MKEVEKQAMHKKSAGSLKKIVAGKGKFNGVFYYASNVKSTEAGVVVQLSNKDPKGGKTATAGKTLRKSITAAKFARGVVDFDKGLLFVIHQGNASASLMLKTFKKNLSKVEGLRFLAKAKVQQKGEEAIGEGGALTAEESADLTLSEHELLELKELNTAIDKGTAKNISEVMGDLLESFLSIDEVENEQSELMTERLLQAEKIDQELAQIDKSTDKNTWEAKFRDLQEARFSIAEINYVGEEPFPEVGATMSDQDIQVMAAAVNASMYELRRQLYILLDEIQNQVGLSTEEVQEKRSQYTAVLSRYQSQLVPLRG